ncbi:MAG TPA: hypothetical protein VGM58_11345, partial [Verrucomicrobiae bacterium]
MTLLLKHEQYDSEMNRAGSDVVIFQLETFYANRSYFFLFAGFSQPDVGQHIVGHTSQNTMNTWREKMVRGAGFEPA